MRLELLGQLVEIFLLGKRHPNKGLNRFEPSEPNAPNLPRSRFLLSMERKQRQGLSGVYFADQVTSGSCVDGG